MRSFYEFSVSTLTAVLGVASLSLFVLFLWAGAFDIVRLPLTGTALLAWDAGLCLLFFVQHSGMIRRPFRARLPAHLQGIVYTIASSGALIALVALWQPSPAVVYAARGPARWLIALALLLALAGFLWGIRSLEGFDAFGIALFRSHLRGQAVKSAPLVARGPYRLVRHPFYSFCIVALWAAPVVTLDRLLFNALFTGWIVLGAALEERDLLATFGEAYRRYRRAVPMFVPRILPRRTPAH